MPAPGQGARPLALAAMLANQGRILALDTSGKKLEELRRRARRAGISNLSAREVNGPVLPAEAKLGGMGSGPGRRALLGPRHPAQKPRGALAALAQGRGRLSRGSAPLLIAYAPLVASGGRLIYATCSVLREENDAVVERFLGERPDFVVMPLKEIWGKARAAEVGDETFLRLLPHVHDTDGFFAAVLRRKD
jgi:16S rRNA (cytosine967-C5)-methyltransferase